MNLISSEKNEKNEVELKIEVTPEELDAAINKAYIKIKNRINVPGFRKGKAPRKIIEKMYGVAVFMNDAVESLLPDVLTFAMESTELCIVGYPKMTDIDFKDNDTRAEITLLAALKPEVKLGKYKGLSAPKPEVKVTEEEIMSEVESKRERNARLESVERKAAIGDIAIIDFEGFLDGKPFEGGKGENYELELGSGSFIPGFEDKIVGMDISEEREIDLVFPENYKKDLAGKAVVFKVKLNELKEKQLPELDDDFAMDVSEFDTLEEYKADIKKKIEERRQKDIDEVFESALMEQILETMEVTIPETMIDEQTDKAVENFSRQVASLGMQPAQYMQMMGMTPDDFKEKMRGNAEQQVKTTLALEKIAELEKLEISDEEIEAEYKRAAEEYKMEVDKFKETVDNDMVIKQLKLTAAANVIRDSAKAEKVKPPKEKKKDGDSESSSE